jgi:RNA polymerase sigma factor (sigma-70 family)
MTDIALPRDRVPGLPRGGRLPGDERLAKLAGKGDERAFAQLYERHHQALYRYCRSVLRNDQDAQDAMQSAMMHAYAALRSQGRELAVKPWLFRIAHNESISLLRKRRPQDELSDAHEQPDAGVEGTLETRERLATLLTDLQALPERQRSALLMRELSGLSIEQIAGALDMSPGAAKQALFEARTSLHELSEGRAMRCESVREAISQRDGRVLRSRRIRSHLRACEDCRAFRAAIGTRSADLAALTPPLPVSVASALLTGLLAHGGGHSGGGAAVTTASSGASSGALGSGTLGPGAAGSGASLAGHAATASLVGKGVAGVAALAIAAAGTAHFASSSPPHPERAHERSIPAGDAAVPSPADTSVASDSRAVEAHTLGARASTSHASVTGERGTSLRASTQSTGRQSSPAQAGSPRDGASSSRAAPSTGHSNGAGDGSDLGNPSDRRGSAGKASHRHPPLNGSRGAQHRPVKNGSPTGPLRARPSRPSRSRTAPAEHHASTNAQAHRQAGSQGSSPAREKADTGM